MYKTLPEQALIAWGSSKGRILLVENIILSLFASTKEEGDLKGERFLPKI